MRLYNIFFLSLALIFISCNDDNDDENPTVNSTDVLENYANIAYSSYQGSYSSMLDLQTKINSFLANPSESGLEGCKQAWLDSREPYGQTEAYRFYNGPIDGNDGDPEGLINSWPLDEAYIDYVSDGAGNLIQNGIIGNESIAITKDELAGLNGGDGSESQEANVSTGYHAIEFLLWGQDLTDGSESGNRSYTDFTTADNAQRRADYLRVVTELLIENLNQVMNQWAPNANNYRAEFVANADGKSIENILSAIGKLSKGELAGERVQKALDERDKEEEHSCFSDNTSRDVVTNAMGIQNVYLGTYGNVSGASLYDLVKAENSDLAEQIKNKIAESVANSKALRQFDQEIRPDSEGGAGGDARIQAVVNSLSQQADMLVEAGKLLGFTFDPADI